MLPEQVLELDLNNSLVLSTILHFLALCDGRKRLGEIVTLFEAAAQRAILDRLEKLISLRMLQDARSAHIGFHGMSVNPAPAPPAFSQDEVEGWPLFRPTSLQDRSMACEGTVVQLPARESASLIDMASRPHTGGGLLTSLSSCLQSGYVLNANKRSVASAGALHPVVVYVAFPAKASEYAFSWYDPTSGQFYHLSTHAIESVEGAFSPDPTVRQLIRDGIGLLFICCDTRRTCGKYGNRGYRFAILEVGAVWQSLDLAAGHLGIPLRAFGGFIDAHCTKLLELPDNVLPMLSAFVGSTCT